MIDCVAINKENPRVGSTVRIVRSETFLFFFQFGCQEDAKFDSFGEARFFVVPAKGGDGVDDAVQLTEGLAG